MTWYPIAFLPPQYQNVSSDNYSGAVLKAYAAGTNTPIAMATTYEGTTTASTFALNASGYPVSGGMVIIPHVQQDYKLALYPNQAAADADSGAVWTYDDIKIAQGTNEAFFQSFSGDGTTTHFTLSEDLGVDEKALLVFADKKFGEYSTNGSFATDTAWTKGSGWTIGAGVATATGAISTDLSQSAAIPIIAEESYTITYTVTRSAGGVIPKIGGRSGTERTASGTYTETIIASSTQAITFSGNAFTGTVDNVSVHRTTAARREILRPDEFVLNGVNLDINEAPASGTSNIVVFAPIRLVGAIGALADAAAISEANAALSATQAEAAADLSAAAAGFGYTYLSATTNSDPGIGCLKFNNTISTATALYLSETTGLAQAIAAEIATWDDSTSTIHAKLRMFKQSDASVYAIYNITGTITDNGTWDTITVAYVSGNGAFANNDEVVVQCIRNGDKGDQGIQGPVGPASGSVLVETAYTNDFTFALADAGGLVSANKATALNGTIPPNASVAFPVDTQILVSQDGAGQLTIVPGAGVTVNYPANRSLKTRKQYSLIMLIKRATNTWQVGGDTEAS